MEELIMNIFTFVLDSILFFIVFIVSLVYLIGLANMFSK